jgi:hypothetical protein
MRQFRHAINRIQVDSSIWGDAIAVDAQRTRNVCELESALSQAEPGETVYLTIVTAGRREQVRVNLPR